MTDDLDIIIVSYNTRDDLVACLASLFDASAGVDSHGHRRRQRVDRRQRRRRARHFPAVQVIALDRNVGFGAANNIGIRGDERAARAAS